VAKIVLLSHIDHEHSVLVYDIDIFVSTIFSLKLINF